MSIVEELREYATHVADGSAIMCVAPSDLLLRAADNIVELFNELENRRTLTRLAVAGQSFADIKREVKKEPDHAA
jgi:hypothetical protein